MLNEELLRRTLDEVRQQAAMGETGGWDQGTWRWVARDDSGRCKTSMCFAGWAIELHIRSLEGRPGMRWLIPDLDDPRDRWVEARNWAAPFSVIEELVWVDHMPEDELEDLDHWYPMFDQHGTEYRVTTAKRAARWLLGLDAEQADRLFGGANRLHMIERLVGQILSDAETVDQGG